VLVAIFTGNDPGDLLRNKLYRLDDEEGSARTNHLLSIPARAR
jgi:hypothetical protein